MFEGKFSLDLPCGTPSRAKCAYIYQAQVTKAHYRSGLSVQMCVLSVPQTYLIVLHIDWHALSQQVLSHSNLASFGRQVQWSHALQPHMLLLDDGTM